MARETSYSIVLGAELRKAIETVAAQNQRPLSFEIRLALWRHVEAENGKKAA